MILTPLQKHLAFYNKQEEILFDEPQHKYYDREDRSIVYTSVTTFLGEFEKKFDNEFWGMYTALKDKGYKVKPQPETNSILIDGKLNKVKSLLKDDLYKHWYAETIAKWKGINAEACLRGNNTHNYLEDTINQSKGMSTGSADNHLIVPTTGVKLKSIETIHDLDNTTLKETYPYIYNRLKGYIERDCVIFAEKRIRLDLARIAGMIDVPIIKRGGNKFCIVDWKTNKEEFKTKAGYYKKIKVGNGWVKSDQFIETNDTLLAPINHLPDCKLYKYALQLSLYAYIMECWGYELVENGLEIIHIRPTAEPKLIKIPYLKDEIEKLMLHRLNDLGIPFYNPDYHKAGKL